MKNYDSLTEALDDLKKRGYEADFDLSKKNFGLPIPDPTPVLDPRNFHVDEVYTFSGDTGPDRNAILFAITSSTGLKGVLVDEYRINLMPFR